MTLIFKMEVKEQGKYGFAISTAQAMVVQDLELAALGFQGTFLLLPGLVVEADFPAVHLPPASEQWQGKVTEFQLSLADGHGLVKRGQHLSTRSFKGSILWP